ncbi:hypothetical protein EVAR_26866_1 [Eumeta japonica]|uniref:Uncharacterized protein n=1 Tax=Eumeta variegata TaxID=151549 RepID=A0A4C1VY57_EUMVA|nr:hypothetical protein EVAR_26866_1 [Eumeta japonica]
MYRDDPQQELLRETGIRVIISVNASRPHRLSQYSRPGGQSFGTLARDEIGKNKSFELKVSQSERRSRGPWLPYRPPATLFVYDSNVSTMRTAHAWKSQEAIKRHEFALSLCLSLSLSLSQIYCKKSHGSTTTSIGAYLPILEKVKVYPSISLMPAQIAAPRRVPSLTGCSRGAGAMT